MRKPLWFFTILSLFTTSAYANEPLDCLIEPYALVDVSSSEIGVLATVGVDEADVVGKDDTLATLNTDVESAALAVTSARAQADSEIKLLRRDHDFNTRKRDRFDELQSQNVVSAQDIDEVRTAQDAAWLRLQAAMERQHTAQLEAIRDELALSRRTVHSPINGVVIRRYKNAGEFVDGDPIVQLAQIDPLLVSMVVPISEFGKIQVGMQATIVPELPIEGPFVASVISIDPMIDAATGTLGVRFSLPNPDYKLPPGLRCTLVLQPLETSISEDNSSDDSNPVAIPLSEDGLTTTDLPPQLGAAVVDLTSADTAFDPSKTLIDSVSEDPSVPAAVQEDAIDKESCSTLGPLQGVEIVDMVSDVLMANDIDFELRYEIGKDEPSADSKVWFDVVGDPADPMTIAVVENIQKFYPELLELPIDCPQGVSW